MSTLPQYELVDYSTRPNCMFCWKEMASLTARVGRSGAIPAKSVRQLANSWLHKQSLSTGLAFYYGAFLVLVAIILWRMPILYSLGMGFTVTLVLALIRTLIVWVFYRSLDPQAEQSIVDAIADHTELEPGRIAEYLGRKFHEVTLWRQYPRGLGTSVAAIYTAVTLDAVTGALIGAALWLSFSLASYSIWKWGHSESLSPTYYSLELKSRWNLLGFLIFPFAFTAGHTLLTLGALFAAMYRVLIGHPAQDFTLLLLLWLFGLMFAIKDDIV